MSIPVALADLAAALSDRPWGYLVTVSDQQQARLLAVPTQFADGVLVVPASGGARSNALVRADVTMVFPPATGTGYSLIVDGRAEAVDDHLEITPATAVLHRPAL